MVTQFRLSAVAFMLLPVGSLAHASAAPEWGVDRRVELASILCRLAGYDEYQAGRLSRYDEAVMRTFSPFKEHEAVRLMRRLRAERGIAYNAAINAALLVDENTWRPRVNTKPVPGFVDRRWDELSFTAFLNALASFARDTRAATFFESQTTLYEQIEQMHRVRFPAQPDLGWFRSQFEVSANTVFRLIPGMLTGAASYGIHVVLPDGRMEVFCVLALPLARENQPLVIPEEALHLMVHEFCHPFVNPWVDAHSDMLRPAGERLFEVSGPAMKAEAYTTWQIMMYESLVRAATARYFADHGNDYLVTYGFEDDRMKGFWWTRELSALFDVPGDATSRILSRDGERVRLFLDDWARDARAGIARVQAAVTAERESRLRRGPQILSLTPADGDTVVDSTITALELRFDRPMTGAMSFYGEFPQVAGKPTWNEDKTVLRIPVTLRRGTKYALAINSDQNSGGFRSAAGEKLTPRTWTFAVK